MTNVYYMFYNKIIFWTLVQYYFKTCFVLQSTVCHLSYEMYKHIFKYIKCHKTIRLFVQHNIILQVTVQGPSVSYGVKCRRGRIKNTEKRLSVIVIYFEVNELKLV